VEPERLTTALSACSGVSDVWRAWARIRDQRVCKRHIKAVADLLGHSSIAITGDVYGHTSDDTARAAVDGLAARLGL
jgi:integrase